VFLGTSLTAGLGVAFDQAYPARIQERIDREGLGYRVVNAGVSGDTSAGGLRRLDWLLEQPFAGLVVELGANDMLRGQDIEAMRRNLGSIVERTKDAHPDAFIVLAGMQAAPNLGPVYAERFRQVFVELAERYQLPRIPFLLEGVAAEPELNQSDGIHPTSAGHAIIADTVWSVLEPILRDSGPRGSSPRNSSARGSSPEDPGASRPSAARRE